MLGKPDLLSKAGAELSFSLSGTISVRVAAINKITTQSTIKCKIILLISILCAAHLRIRFIITQVFPPNKSSFPRMLVRCDSVKLMYEM